MEAATKQYVDNQVGNIDVPSATEVGTVPPNNPIEGALWWDTNDGRLYVYYTDINSSQWVPAIPETVIATATVINSDDVEYYLTGVSAPFDGNDDQLNYSTNTDGCHRTQNTMVGFNLCAYPLKEPKRNIYAHGANEIRAKLSRRAS